MIGVVDIAHYRGSEKTGLLPAPLGVFGGGGVFLVFTDFRRAGGVRVGVGGCVLFEKCIVDASIKCFVLVFVLQLNDLWFLFF